jgi:3-phenylpropionate/trans-cinnamate dioxygenase ferredoxin reductase component
MNNYSDVLIVGGGHAGAQAAIALRQQRFPGSITLMGEEPDLPYERPPLSKEYLQGERTFERILLRPPEFWTERGVAFLTGQRVTAVDASAHTVTTAIGYHARFGKLIWATGGHARRISCTGHHLIGVHTVRKRADVDQLRLELAQTVRVVVIGGGYIGLEASAVLRKLGKQVVLLEASDRVLNRVAGEPLSRFFESAHRAQGVDVRLNTEVDCILEDNDRANGVRLATGECIAADMVIVGIGIIPAVEPLRAAGAIGDIGIDVDEYCRTSLADVYAIGDCAQHRSRFSGGIPVRIESVQNANDMGTCVAKMISGNPEPYNTVPWFWSNQYDLRLQTVGLSLNHDVAVLRGDPATRSFSVVYCRDGRVIALDCVNASQDFVQGKALVTQAVMADRDKLTDKSVPLKTLLT